MKATRRDSFWSSVTYLQDAGDGDWATCTSLIEAQYKKVTLEPTSTATSLITSDDVDIQSGDTLLVKVGEVYSEIQAEGASPNTPGVNVSIVPSLSQGQATPSSVITNLIGQVPQSTTWQGNQNVFSDDGMRVWMLNGFSWASGADNTWSQVELSEPFNLNSATSVSGSFVAKRGASYSSWCWANKGRYIFATTPINGYIARWTCSTPYDMSTASNEYQMRNPTYISTTYNGWLNICWSDDGLRWMVKYYNITFIYGTCTIPFDWNGGVTNLGTLTSSSIGGVNSEYLNFYEGGVCGVGYEIDIAAPASCFVDLIRLTVPCDPTTAVVTRRTFDSLDYTDYMSLTTNNNGELRYVADRNLRYVVLFAEYNNLRYKAWMTLKTDIGDSKTIDISTQGLSGVPTEVYVTKAPTLKIATSHGTTPRLFNERLALWGSTTSTATIISSDETLLSVGDTVLLNNTDSVTITGVTSTSGAAAYTTGKYVQSKSTGMTQFSPTNGVPTYGWGPNFQFSSNGMRLFVAKGAVAQNISEYTAGLYVFDLTVPWDISTLSDNPSQFMPSADLFSVGGTTLTNDPFTYNRADQFQSSGLHISPDGLTFNIMAKQGRYARVITITVTEPWNIYSPRTSIYSAETSVVSTSYSDPTDMVFGVNGDKAWIVDSYRAYNYGHYFKQYNCSTPHNFASGFTSSGAWTGNSAIYYPPKFRFNPSGDRLYAAGSMLGQQGADSIDDTTDAGYKYLDISSSPNSIPSSGTWTTTATLDNRSAFAGNVGDFKFSPDGLRLYLMNTDGVIYQWDIKEGAHTQYDITFATQGSAPTSVYFPDESVAPTMTTSDPSPIGNSPYANVTHTGSELGISGARSINMKLDGGSAIGAVVDTIRVDMKKAG
tara:strand:- start:4478 stop:7126 length:2649 start_codon:yes stop_codon:yes gene_type:complete